MTDGHQRNIPQPTDCSVGPWFGTDDVPWLGLIIRLINDPWLPSMGRRVDHEPSTTSIIWACLGNLSLKERVLPQGPLVGPLGLSLRRFQSKYVRVQV